MNNMKGRMCTGTMLSYRNHSKHPLHGGIFYQGKLEASRANSKSFDVMAGLKPCARVMVHLSKKHEHIIISLSPHIQAIILQTLFQCLQIGTSGPWDAMTWLSLELRHAAAAPNVNHKAQQEFSLRS
jgi:hypothetical protein